MSMSVLTLKTRLFGLTGGLLLLFGLTVVTNWWHLTQLEQQSSVLAETEIPILSHLLSLQQLQTAIHATLIEGLSRSPHQLPAKEVLERQHIHQQTLLTQIEQLLNESTRSALNSYQQHHLNQLKQQILRLREQQETYQASLMKLVQLAANPITNQHLGLQTQLENLQTVSNNLRNSLETFSGQQLTGQQVLITQVRSQMAILAGFFVLLAIILSVSLYLHLHKQLGAELNSIQRLMRNLLQQSQQDKHISLECSLYEQLALLQRNLTQLLANIQRLAEGHTSLVYTDNVDSTRLHQALNQVSQRLINLKQLAVTVVAGDYGQRLTPNSEQDQISHSVNKMLNQVQQVTEQSRRSDWLKTGQTELTERIRGEQPPVQLMQNVLSYLSKYLQAQVGVFYLCSDQQLNLVCSYAYQIRNNNNNSFLLGEGLIGQAALEQKTIIFNQIPPQQQFLSINTGLDQVLPSAVCVLPLRYESDVLGVLAFGTQYEFSQAHLELLERVTDNIAISLKSALSRLEMQALLEESQHLTEELQSQQSEIVSRETRIQAIVDTVVDAIITIDPIGCVESFNKGAERIFGYSSEEVIGRNIAMLMPEPYHSEHDQYLARYLAEGDPRVIGHPREVQGRHKDGSIFPIDLAVNEMWLGEQRLFTGIVRDITERKRSEATLRANQLELQEREARIRAIVDTVADAIITIDDHGHIESFNKAAEHLFGYASHEVIGEIINILMPEPHYSQHDDYLTHYLNTGEARIIGNPRELVARHQSGNTFPIDLAVGEMNVGEHRLFTGIIRDITERKRAEEELRLRQEELQTQNEEMQAQNEELQAQQEELQSQQDELRKINEALEVRTHELEQQKIEIHRQNKALEQHQVEIELKAEELAKASQYKSEFLANMSHELRTPLNSLLILAQLLSENRDQNLTDKQIDYARTIHSSGTDLLTLINEILDLSKIEAGHIEIIPRNVPFDTLFDSLHWKFQHIAESRHLDFVQHRSDKVPERIYTDEQRLTQILNNLLSNAFKFTSEGEVRLFIELEEETKGLGAGQWVAFRVIDSGIGIPADKQNLIFEAFKQVDGTTSRRYGGTGLGLSISRQLARALGGELFLHSVLGEGSTFSLLLPLQTTPHGQTSKASNSLIPAPLKPSAPSPSITDITAKTKATPTPSTVDKVDHHETVAEEARQLPGLPSGSRRFAPAPVPFLMFTPPVATVPDDRDIMESGDPVLLVIDDDVNFLGILKDLANEVDFKCLLAEDGMTGLLLAEEYRPSAIVLDVNLPRIDGWGVMESLKDGANTRHIPVYFVSGTDKPHLARELGAIGFLLKPASLESLNTALNTIKQFISRASKSVLLCVASDNIQQQILSMIDHDNINVITVANIDELLEILDQQTIDCVILEQPQFDCIYRLKQRENIEQLPIILYAEPKLNIKLQANLTQFEHMTVKVTHSLEQLFDQVMLFLHQMEASLPLEKQRILRLAHAREALLENKKVLIVDDDVRNTFALTTFLEGRDMEVLVAEDGLEALDLLEQHPETAIVLMDIMMPEMDGYEAMRQIRAQPSFLNLPIIALTAKAMKGDRSKCIEAGASDYLTKPVDTDRLISLMRVWLYR